MSFKKPTNEDLFHRFSYHSPDAEQVKKYAAIRAKILECAEVCVGLTPCCPEQTRALNALDEAMFLFNASVARNDDGS